MLPSICHFILYDKYVNDIQDVFVSISFVFVFTDIVVIARFYL